MKRKLVIMMSLVGLLAGGNAFAGDDALLNKLVEKGTITREEADAIRSSGPGGSGDAQNGNAAAPPQKNQKGLTLGGINLQVGGFIEAATIYRSRTESTDIGSSFSGIPFSNNSKYHVAEFRGTARQSRLSLLAQGDYSKDTHLAAYYELDFLGASATSNSNESNSFLPRTRHLYATIDWDNLGLHLLTGQTWSLATMNSKGITPRNEWIPLTIDAQYVAGFTWARQWQARIVKDWNKTVWAALSFENPQTTTGGNAPSPASALYSFPGTGQLNTGGSFSINYFPDVIAKVAVEPGWGHYEIYDLFRSYEWTALDGTGHKRTTSNAVGAGAILPIVPGLVDFSASALYGHGIGRYGTSQLADATFNSDGKLVPLRGHQVLVGVAAHPNKDWDVYAYAGQEKVDKEPSGGTVGYGNPAFNISACGAAATAAGACPANVNTVDQLAGGFWWKFYQGNMGKAQFGIQYSYTNVSTYAGSNGAGGELAPSTNDHMVFTSFRYYPL